MTVLRERAPGKVNLCLFLGPARSDGYHELVSVLEPLDARRRARARPRERRARRDLLRGGGGAEPRRLCARGVPRGGRLGGLPGARAHRQARARRGRDGRGVERRGGDTAPRGAGSRPGRGAARRDRTAARSRRTRSASPRSGAGDRRRRAGPSADRRSRRTESWCRPRPSSSRPRRSSGRPIASGCPVAAPTCSGSGAGSSRRSPPVSCPPLVNDLEPAARSLCPSIDGALRSMRDAGAEHALVSGSGPTVFGLFASQRAARAAAARLPGAIEAAPA